MKKFNTFVRYHGCNIGYKDGTRQTIFKTCSRPTYNPFWKSPEHGISRVAKSTRAQLKNKPLAYKNILKIILTDLTLDIVAKLSEYWNGSAIIVLQNHIQTQIQTITATLIHYQTLITTKCQT